MKSAGIVGQRFNRLVAISIAGKNDANKILVLCKCDCGNSAVVRKEYLLSGHTKSCGCLAREISSRVNLSHGDKCNGQTTPEYRAWAGAKNRVTNKNNPKFKHYGGRGITMCKRWLGSFEDFLFDMGRKPSLKHTLGRKDNDGPYSPSNCRWETQSEQSVNKQNTRFITANGVTKAQCEWAKSLGISDATICKRIKRGWSELEAVTA